MKNKKNKKLTTTLECPRCHSKWAILEYRHNSIVKAADIKVLEGESFKDGDDLVCRKCQFPYTNWDIELAVAPRIKIAKKEAPPAS